MNSPPDELVAAAPVIAEFDRLSVKYYVGGSLASSAFGLGRSTNDVDLVAELSSRDVAALVERLSGEFYISAPMIDAAIANRSCFNIIYQPISFKVDVFISKGRPYDRAAMARARIESLDYGDDKLPVALASPEDIVLSKLEWFRLGDEVSERQWLDVQGVLKVQEGALDLEYLRHWAREINVADLLESALAESTS